MHKNPQMLDVQDPFEQIDSLVLFFVTCSFEIHAYALITESNDVCTKHIKITGINRKK